MPIHILNDFDKENAAPAPKPLPSLPPAILTTNNNVLSSNHALLPLSKRAPLAILTNNNANLPKFVGKRPMLKSVFGGKGSAVRVERRETEEDEEDEETNSNITTVTTTTTAIAIPHSKNTSITLISTTSVPPPTPICMPKSPIRISAPLSNSIPTTCNNIPFLHTVAPLPAQPLPSTPNPVPPPPSGSLTDKREIIINKRVYYILDRIGKGGTSVVYRVLSKEKQLFACKEMNLTLAMSNGERSALINVENEISLMKKMKGEKTVIQLIDYEEKKEVKRSSDGRTNTEQILYMLLELGQQDLSRYISTHKAPLPLLELKFYWQQILLCVNTCHMHGILHLDLKPANFVLIDGMIKIIDFGIAKSLGEGEAAMTSIVSESQVGTLNYMSPESLDEKSNNNSNKSGLYKIGRKSDIWSLGCILYQLVYGSTPFSSIPNMFAKMKAITSKKYCIPFPQYVEIKNNNDYEKSNSKNSTATSTVKIDDDLLDVMRMCLDREVSTRASIEELLNHSFLTGRKQMKEENTDYIYVNKKKLLAFYLDLGKNVDEAGKLIDLLKI